MLHVPWEKGDFSTPLRFGRNDGGCGRLFFHWGREISPLRFATVEMTRGALATIVISSGAACRYGADGKRSHDTLSREIFHRNAARTIRGGDFSTPLRFGRNDGGRGPAFFIICARRALPSPSAREGCRPLSEAMQPFYTTCGGAAPPFFNMTVCCPLPPSSRAGLRVDMGQRENALMIL